MSELECPSCGYEFILDDDYLTGDCENCHKTNYYWDYVLDDETYEELFSGYYWNTISPDEWREKQLKDLGI
jgi:hypothetical protein